MWRTRRLIALAATFLILGLGSAVLTHYLPDLVKNSGNGIRITVPKQTPADSITSFAQQISELGTLVVVVVAAASLTIDAQRSLATFYRTRVHQPARLILPRYTVITAASIAALALGTLGSWYETTVLIGHIPVGPLVVGLVLEAIWLGFATSIVTLFASMFRGVVSVVGGSIAALLALNLLGDLSVASSWLPTRLAASAAALVHHPAGNLWHAVIVSGIATIAALSFAVNRVGNREL